MLFTDGTILTMQDLREHDSFVLEVSSTESIELSTKLAVAQRAIGYELASFLMNRDTPLPLSRVVVNDELRDVLALHTLAAVYSDAYNRHLNDRYLGRARDLRQASERSFQRLLQNGVGIANSPVPRAEQPAVTAIEGSLEPGVYTVQIAWEHLGRSVGERSEELTVESSTGGLVIAAPPVPSNIAGWHVFIASVGSKATRQNESLNASDAAWAQVMSLRTDLIGPRAAGADFYVRQAAQLVRR